MTSVSEKTFGARLLHAQDILNYVQGFAGYNPPDKQENVTGFGTLVQSVAGVNDMHSQSEQQYKAAVRARSDAFKSSNTGSIMKLLPQIRGAVLAKYGKGSQEYAAVTAIVNKMKVHTLTPVPVAGTPYIGQVVCKYCRIRL